MTVQEQLEKWAAGDFSVCSAEAIATYRKLEEKCREIHGYSITRDELYAWILKFLREDAQRGVAGQDEVGSTDI